MLQTQNKLNGTLPISEAEDVRLKMLEKKTRLNLKKYLMSSLFQQIGPVLAFRIVDTFGTEAVRIIETAPIKLREIPGIGRQRLDNIKRGWDTQKTIKRMAAMIRAMRAAHNQPNDEA